MEMSPYTTRGTYTRKLVLQHMGIAFIGVGLGSSSLGYVVADVLQNPMLGKITGAGIFVLSVSMLLFITVIVKLFHSKE